MRMLPERPTMNGEPGCLASRLKAALHPQPVAHAQGPSGPLPQDKPVVYGRARRGTRLPTRFRGFHLRSPPFERRVSKVDPFESRLSGTAEFFVR